ncbi:unnamed protein product [Rhizophagus irregularis]|nr:unnamed protein product [Rhizophagus irregularis]
MLSPHDNAPTKETPVPHGPDNTSFGTYKFPHSRQYNDNVTIITPQDHPTDAPHFLGSFTHDTPTMANTIGLSYDERHALTQEIIKREYEKDIS